MTWWKLPPKAHYLRKDRRNMEWMEEREKRPKQLLDDLKEKRI